MAGLVVPALDEVPWPTLGHELADFLEERAVYGPGDLRGEPYVVDDEFRAILCRLYEVYPKGHPRAGRRRYKRGALSQRKGTAKTEKLALVAFAELHPEAPVRCDGFRRQGSVWVPVGRPVRDPYIPLVSHTEEQSEELAYGALLVIVQESPDVDLFDPGLERIMRYGGDGKCVALAGAPDSRDGARTTFQGFDETHRLTSARHVEAHGTMLANVPKRPAADAWTLETSTMYAPGEGSIAEKTHDYARLVAGGVIDDPRLFYFHRQASDELKLDSVDAVREGIVEASGPVATWSDVDDIVQLWLDPTTDRAYFDRVWLNRPAAAADKAFDAKRWRELGPDLSAGEPRPTIAEGRQVALGFDGAKFHDSTGLVMTDLATGLQVVRGRWEQPHGPAGDGWEVDEREVDEAVEEAFDLWRVVLFYADPPYWETSVSKWAGTYGERRVRSWWTNRTKPTAWAVRAYVTAQRTGELQHDGDPDLARHIGNARRADTRLRDEQGQPLYLLRKERHDSPLKIDLAMAGVLSWEARRDAIAGGALVEEPEPDYAVLSHR